MSLDDEGRIGDWDLSWRVERRELLALYNRGRLAPRGGPRGRRVPLSQARAHARAHASRPEIMDAWASVPLGGRIPDEAWDLITEFNAYLWVKTGCSQDLLAGIGATVRRLALGEFESSESDAFAEALLRDPAIVDDRGGGR